MINQSIKEQNRKWKSRKSMYLLCLALHPETYNFHNDCSIGFFKDVWLCNPCIPSVWLESWNHFVRIHFCKSIQRQHIPVWNKRNLGENQHTITNYKPFNTYVPFPETQIPHHPFNKLHLSLHHHSDYQVRHQRRRGVVLATRPNIWSDRGWGGMFWDTRSKQGDLIGEVIEHMIWISSWHKQACSS